MDNDFALDKIFLDLKDENLSDTLSLFAQTIYFTQKEKIPIICNKLVQRLPGRIKSLNAYAHFIHFLARGSQKYQYKREFANELLDKVFMKPVLLDFIYHKIPIFSVLRLCIELGTFDIEDIKARVLKNFQLRSRYSLIMALFFLPEIRDVQCQKFLANFLTANVQGTSLIGNSLFLELNMDNLVADDYALLKSFIKTGSQHNEFAICCKNDDMNRLQDLSMASNFDLNMRISNNFFEHCFFCHANPPLISYAAAYGSIKCFKFLLLNNADLNICDDDNFYPEHFAIVGGNVEIIHLIEQRRFDETNTLQIASLFYYDAVFEWLLNTRKINVLSAASTLYSVVHTCAIANNFHAMSLVLSLGADVNARGNDTLTALMLAACFGSYETAKILVTNSKINLSVSNRHKQTALHAAAIFGDSRIIKLLREAGAYANAFDIERWTPLHHACFHGNCECVRELLEFPDVDVHLKTLLGETPMMLALSNYQINVVKLFIEMNLLDPNDKNNIGMSALHVSCAKGLYDVVKYFLERDDVDVNCKNEMGQTPIFECVNQGHNEILKMLLERKEINIDVKDIFGQSIVTMLRTIENKNVRETIEDYIKSKQ